MKKLTLLLIFTLIISCVSVRAGDENGSYTQRFVIYSTSLDETGRVAVADTLKRIVNAGSVSDADSAGIAHYFPEFSEKLVNSILQVFSKLDKNGIESMCDLILFGTPAVENLDKMPSITKQLNRELSGSEDDNRITMFFFSLMSAYSLYTIFGGSPDIACNMYDLPGLVNLSVNSDVPSDIASKISSLVELMPEFSEKLAPYSGATTFEKILELVEDAVNSAPTDEIYYFKVAMNVCGVFHGDWPSMRGNEKFDGLTFRDIDGCAWAHEAIKNMSGSGIISGNDKYRFAPNDSILREQFVKLIVMQLGLDTANADSVAFEDVSEGEWYYPYICAAYKSGIITGETKTKFGLGSKVSREQMSAIIYRAYTAKKVDFSGNVPVKFADMSSVSSYAKDAVNAMSANGIISGVGQNRFAPKQSATRAEAAVMINRAAEFAK